ncbi:peptidoglycan D,D-transpeptidase FtsI family protein [Bailinhaonella thermotolerans]|uniref:Penicillin-binding protein 2 n=1 Tax=Bailinhaonella thermotolerans TaxID=1070861 RepID=A0A3A4AV87_9ACTN|nr:penicillin-binding protein 2 [Bailinhaonella thermotolerans]RJL32185.1 penicillin-binding protein 2 [Bailinhaonella thermotolerans]
MNKPIRRVAIACLLMFGLLLVNANYLQAIKAEDLRKDSRNSRNFFARYKVDRGSITAGNVTLAESKEVGGEFKYQRNYPHGPLYAHVTGFFGPENAIGVEGAENSMLDGSDSRLAVSRFVDMVTGKPPKGATIEVTINPKAQKAAYNALKASGKKGAVVALDPKTGAILTLVSVPTYDPNQLAPANKAKVNEAYNKLDKDKDKPLLNRALNQAYPPGSTYKVVTAAAFLSDDEGRNAQTQVDAPTSLDLPQTSHNLPNSGGAACGSGQVTLMYALQRSCNTPFAKMGMELGYNKMNEQAKKFGVGEPLSVPAVVDRSDFGPADMTQASLAMSSIGQFSVSMTPLQMAMVAAGIANEGKVMKPYLVKKVVGPDNSEIEATEPSELSEAVTPEVAHELRDMMKAVVSQGTGSAAQIQGVEVAGKTGTAQTEPGRAPHAWFISFAPASDPKVAVAVIVESGSAGTEASGGQTAAPIAREVIKAVVD